MDNLKLIKTENRAGKVKLNDAVTPWSADDLIADIQRLYGENAVKAQMVVNGQPANEKDALTELHIELNSPGGSVLDGYRIYNEILQLRARGVRVVATVNSIAASMASVIAMAADAVRMTTGSRMMIHEASMATYGDADRHRNNADLLESMSAEIAGIYSKRTGMDRDEIRAEMRKEKWMSADEAVALKFADEVLEFDTLAKGMSILARIFKNDPEAAANVEAVVIENDTLRADLADAQARIDELAPLAEANASLQADLASVQAKADEAEKQAQELQAKLTEAESQNEITAEKISARAAEMLAATGHPQPVQTTPQDGNATNQKTMAEFNQLNPHEKMQFVRNGGKITE
jgi:ATP-dependent protease ClpP protease subunit